MICGDKDGRKFKEEKSIEILKILGLFKKIFNYCKNMTEENIGREYSLKNIHGKEIVSLKK